MRRYLVCAVFVCALACKQEHAAPASPFAERRAGSGPVALFNNGGFEGGEVNSAMMFVTLKELRQRPPAPGSNKVMTQQEMMGLISKEFQKFDALVTGLLKVPHSEIKRKLDAHNRKRERKRRAKALKS